jgi:hypothetical protein
MQGDHDGSGTWNNQVGQQQPHNAPNAYFQQSGMADRNSSGASKLSEVLVQALVTWACQALATPLTNHSCNATQTGKDLTKCTHAVTNQYCVLWDREPLHTTFIHEECLPPGATPKVIAKRSGQTLAGILHTTRAIELQELVLPEFSHSSLVYSQQALYSQANATMISYLVATSCAIFACHKITIVVHVRFWRYYRYETQELLH